MDLEGHQKLGNFQNLIHILILISIKKMFLHICGSPQVFTAFVFDCLPLAGRPPLGSFIQQFEHQLETGL